MQRENLLKQLENTEKVWNFVVVGTTDIQRPTAESEPRPLDEEIEFILETASHYMTPAPTRADIVSVFAGQRPLAAPKKEGKKSKEVSRSHKVVVSENDLITITGGKWTSYRKMAEELGRDQAWIDEQVASFTELASHYFVA